MLAEFNRLLDRPGDAAHLISVAYEGVLEHVCHENVIFGNQDLEHRGFLLVSGRRVRCDEERTASECVALAVVTRGINLPDYVLRVGYQNRRWVGRRCRSNAGRSVDQDLNPTCRAAEDSQRINQPSALIVILARAGTQASLGPRFRGDDEKRRVPAKT